ncbi:hypothetical protein SCUP234_09556 [Seiridium cupressi]
MPLIRRVRNAVLNLPERVFGTVAQLFCFRATERCSRGHDTRYDRSSSTTRRGNNQFLVGGETPTTVAYARTDLVRIFDTKTKQAWLYNVEDASETAKAGVLEMRIIDVPGAIPDLAPTWGPYGTTPCPSSN